jgi:hypothetical protein
MLRDLFTAMLTAPVKALWREEPWRVVAMVAGMLIVPPLAYPPRSPTEGLYVCGYLAIVLALLVIHRKPLRRACPIHWPQ